MASAAALRPTPANGHLLPPPHSPIPAAESSSSTLGRVTLQVRFICLSLGMLLIVQAMLQPMLAQSGHESVVSHGWGFCGLYRGGYAPADWGGQLPV